MVVKEVPFEIAERLAYLLGELRDEGIPEEYEEEVDEALTRFELWKLDE